MEDQLKAIIAGLLDMSADPAAIPDGASLFGGVLSFDSFKLLQLIIETERHFGIGISEEEFDVRHFTTISSLAEYLRAEKL